LLLAASSYCLISELSRYRLGQAQVLLQYRYGFGRKLPYARGLRGSFFLRELLYVVRMIFDLRLNELTLELVSLEGR
jgi:hypothetical protein